MSADEERSVAAATQEMEGIIARMKRERRWPYYPTLAESQRAEAIAKFLNGMLEREMSDA